MRNLLEEAMLDELEEITKEDLADYYFVNELPSIFSTGQGIIYKMLKEIKPKKYKLKVETKGNYCSFNVLVHKNCTKQFESWLNNRAVIQRRKVYKDRELERFDKFNNKIDNQEKKNNENLEELRKLHPLVTDDRFFKLSYFPDVELDAIEL